MIYLRLTWVVCLLLIICLSCDLLLGGLPGFAGDLVLCGLLWGCGCGEFWLLLLFMLGCFGFAFNSGILDLVFCFAGAFLVWVLGIWWLWFGVIWCDLCLCGWWSRWFWR